MELATASAHNCRRYSGPFYITPLLVESKQEYIEGFIPAIVTMLLPYSDAITRTQDTGDPAIIPGYL